MIQGADHDRSARGSKRGPSLATLIKLRNHARRSIDELVGLPRLERSADVEDLRERVARLERGDEGEPRKPRSTIRPKRRR
jgi:hypothetical protein